MVKYKYIHIVTDILDESMSKLKDGDLIVCPRIEKELITFDTKINKLIRFATISFLKKIPNNNETVSKKLGIEIHNIAIAKGKFYANLRDWDSWIKKLK